MLVKIKSNSTKKETRYKTSRDIHEELKHLEDRGVDIIQMRYYDESQSFGECEKLIVIAQ